MNENQQEINPNELQEIEDYYLKQRDKALRIMDLYHNSGGISLQCLDEIVEYTRLTYAQAVRIYTDDYRPHRSR